MEAKVLGGGGMSAWAAQLWAFIVHSGAFGLLLLGVLDSSFLMLPVWNDLLLVTLTVENPARLPLYVLAASVGSVCGVALLDLVCRKGGEKGLEKMMSAKRLKRLKCRIERRAAAMLIVATLSPPPFPFTVVIAGASALQYPRMRLLSIVFATRVVRYLLEGLVALRWGRGVIRMMEAPKVRYGIAIFAAICLAGSAISVVRWIRRSRYRYAA